MEELIVKTISWGMDRNIFSTTTPQKQLLKSASELGEFCDALVKEDIEHARTELGDFIVTLILFSHITKAGYPCKTFEVVHSDAFESFDVVAMIFSKFAELTSLRYDLAIDMATALDNIAHLITYAAESIGSSPEECLRLAYDKISQRKGKMVNGVFVKDGT